GGVLRLREGLGQLQPPQQRRAAHLGPGLGAGPVDEALAGGAVAGRVLPVPQPALEDPLEPRPIGVRAGAFAFLDPAHLAQGALLAVELLALVGAEGLVRGGGGVVSSDHGKDVHRLARGRTLARRARSARPGRTIPPWSEHLLRGPTCLI